MEGLPLISVIVPVYRVETYLDRCISSIVEQTYENLEILLIDDGSPDGSGAICDAWAQRDGRIRVIHQENAGAGAARNAGLELAKGQWISMIDSDDYLEKHMYEHLYSLTGEDVDIAECQIGETTGDDLPMEDGTQARVTVCDRETAMRLHIRDELFCQTPPNKLYCRETIGEVRFPVGNLIDDEFFTYRVIGNARKLAHSSACMYAYRQTPGSAMHKPFSRKRLQGLQAKVQRLAYLRAEMPGLVAEGKFDLFFTCLYAMQGCLRWLEGEELEAARREIGEILDKIEPVPENPEASKKKNLLLKVARKNPEGTCRVMNLLEDLHILT